MIYLLECSECHHPIGILQVDSEKILWVILQYLIDEWLCTECGGTDHFGAAWYDSNAFVVFGPVRWWEWPLMMWYRKWRIKRVKGLKFERISLHEED